MEEEITYWDVLRARDTIARKAACTPLIRSGYIDELTGAKIMFKCENLQRTGSFKFRGASNAVWTLDDDELRNGVTTHSSGNHAQALALAAKERGVPAHIVMPKNSPKVKIEGVRYHGASITFCEPTLASRQTTLEKVQAETGATFIHPYDNPLIIAGQGTCAAEIFEADVVFDIIATPLGGGGLLSGTCITTRAVSKETRIYGVEPEMADDAKRSLEAGRIIPSEDPKTIADGLRTSLSDRTFSILSTNVNGIVTSSETSIVKAMRLIWEKTKLLVEPSSAVTLGAILEGNLEVEGCTVALVLSGGNVDLDSLPWTTQG